MFRNYDLVEQPIHLPSITSKLVYGEHGPYGDAVEEMDWGVGQVRNTLDRLGLAQLHPGSTSPPIMAGTQKGKTGWDAPMAGAKWKVHLRAPSEFRASFVGQARFLQVT
nr:hypothetical protein BaRGS_026439 [Batillaria attramentaria]